MTKERAIILAVGPKNIIGKGDKLAWHSKLDFKHFKDITRGNVCLFGATTFFGLPVYPLQNRLNIVLDNTKKKAVDISNDSYLTFKDIKKAYEFCSNYDKVLVCGGKSIYEYVYNNNLINTIYLTKIESKSLKEEAENNLEQYVTLDIDFSNLKGWVCASSEAVREDDMELKFLKYIKIEAE